jgi:DNA-binding beta-propeller fold protein YncE
MGVAFDGTNIWVANMSGNSATRLRASDGAPMGTFTTGSAPEGIAFDGVFIWITNHSGSSASKM